MSLGLRRYAQVIVSWFRCAWCESPFVDAGGGAFSGGPEASSVVLLKQLYVCRGTRHLLTALLQPKKQRCRSSQPEQIITKYLGSAVDTHESAQINSIGPDWGQRGLPHFGQGPLTFVGRPVKRPKGGKGEPCHTKASWPWGRLARTGARGGGEGVRAWAPGGGGGGGGRTHPPPPPRPPNLSSPQAGPACDPLSSKCGHPQDETVQLCSSRPAVWLAASDSATRCQGAKPTQPPQSQT